MLSLIGSTPLGAGMASPMQDFTSPSPSFAPQRTRLWDSTACCRAIAGEHPEVRAWHLRFQSEDVPREVPENWQPQATEGEVLCAVAVPLTGPGGQADFTQVLDLLPALHEAPDFLLISLNSAARVFFFRAQSYDSTDLMGAAATRLLLEQIDREHKDATARFDLPTLFSEYSCPERDCLPWSPLLPDAFSADHGYSLMARLPSLVADTGPDAARVRQHFWLTVVRLLRQNLWAPLHEFEAARHTLSFGLSAAGQEPLRAATLHYGDIAPAQRILTNAGCTPDAGILAARLCASIAALEGKPCARAAIEANRNPHDMLPGVLRLLCQGINRIALSDCQPPTENCQVFADAVARYCYVLAQGRTAARVGVLLSTRSAWAHHHPRGHRFTRWVDEDLHGAAQLLDALHFDYVLLPEEDLCAARCDGQKLLCGAAALPLEMILVPGATTFSWAALRKIEEFVAGGGKAAFLGLLPRWSENGRDEELEKRISKMTMVIAGDIYDAHAGQGTASEVDDATIGYPITRENAAGGRLCVYQPRLNEDRDDARLRVQKILKESLAADLETQSPHLLYTHRILDEGDVYFVLNGDENIQRVNMRLRPSRFGRPHFMDAWSGQIKPLSVWMQYSDEEGDGLSLELELAAHEARLIWIAAEAEPFKPIPHAERATFVVEQFDGIAARGYATQNGEPRLAVRQGGKLIWYSAPLVTVPAPLMLNEDAPLDCEPCALSVPPEWAGCRVFLELAGLHATVEAFINGQSCGLRMAAPYRFEVTEMLATDESNEVRLCPWNGAVTPATELDESASFEASALARLVAYPAVAISLEPGSAA
ncbi:MAG TPA: hypothetical protein VNA16_05580 [Abditibacteriaceae bacterium]|nr:hypothetical protein [Abditibacteriaceae bacterium]